MTTKFKIKDSEDADFIRPKWYYRALASCLQPDPARGPRERTFSDDAFKMLLADAHATIVYPNRDNDDISISWIEFSTVDDAVAFKLRWSE